MDLGGQYWCFYEYLQPCHYDKNWHFKRVVSLFMRLINVWQKRGRILLRSTTASIAKVIDLEVAS